MTMRAKLRSCLSQGLRAEGKNGFRVWGVDFLSLGYRKV